MDAVFVREEVNGRVSGSVVSAAVGLDLFLLICLLALVVVFTDCSSDRCALGFVCNKPRAVPTVTPTQTFHRTNERTNKRANARARAHQPQRPNTGTKLAEPCQRAAAARVTTSRHVDGACPVRAGRLSPSLRGRPRETRVLFRRDGATTAGAAPVKEGAAEGQRTRAPASVFPPSAAQQSLRSTTV